VSKLQFKGPVIVIEGDDDEVTDINKIKSLDGLKYDDEDAIFSEYMSDGGDSTLEDAGISGGLMFFEFDSTANALFGYVEYQLTRPLDDTEIEELKDYTIGQLTDGIGSNFEQERMSEGELLPFINYEEFSVKCS